MRRIAIAVVATLGSACTASAETEAELAQAMKQIEAVKLGGVYRYVESKQYYMFNVGCEKHGDLMFLVRLGTGDKADREIAIMATGQTCDPLITEARYKRCGKGGFTFPQDGDHWIFSKYCRLGHEDKPIYILDAVMEEARPVEKPQDCVAQAKSIAQAVNSEAMTRNDVNYSADLTGELFGKQKFTSNSVSFICDPWSAPMWNTVWMQWAFGKRPSSAFLQALGRAGKIVVGDAPDAIVQAAPKCIESAIKDERGTGGSETRRSRLTCLAHDNEISLFVEAIEKPEDEE